MTGCAICRGTHKSSSLSHSWRARCAYLCVCVRVCCVRVVCAYLGLGKYIVHRAKRIFSPNSASSEAWERGTVCLEGGRSRSLRILVCRKWTAVLSLSTDYVSANARDPFSFFRRRTRRMRGMAWNWARPSWYYFFCCCFCLDDIKHEEEEEKGCTWLGLVLCFPWNSIYILSRVRLYTKVQMRHLGTGGHPQSLGSTPVRRTRRLRPRDNLQSIGTRTEQAHPKTWEVARSGLVLAHVPALQDLS